MTARGKNIVVLVLIIGTFIAFALAGRFLIHPEDMQRTNKGHLIVPHIQVQSLSLQAGEGAAWGAGDMAGRWSLMYVAGEQCRQACRNTLFYLMHRLRQALGRDNDRLRLILVHTSPASADTRAFIDEKVPGLVELRGDATTVNQALAAAFESGQKTAVGHLFLAAPDGQIFMWYPTHKAMEKVLREADNIHSDLKRTLKGSLIG